MLDCVCPIGGGDAERGSAGGLAAGAAEDESDPAMEAAMPPPQEYAPEAIGAEARHEEHQTPPASSAVEEALPAEARNRIRADVRMEVPGGVLTYYSNKSVFTATCRNPAHGRRVLTRSSDTGRRAGQGRPLGLSSAWLFTGQDAPTRGDHMERALFPNHAMRAFHREAPLRMPGAAELFRYERGQMKGVR